MTYISPLCCTIKLTLLYDVSTWHDMCIVYYIIVLCNQRGVCKTDLCCWSRAPCKKALEFLNLTINTFRQLALKLLFISLVSKDH